MKQQLLLCGAALLALGTAAAQQSSFEGPVPSAQAQAPVMELNAEMAQPAGELAEAPEGYQWTPEMRRAAAKRVAYRRPAGAFYGGVSTKTNLKTAPFIFTFPFNWNVWTNISTGVDEGTQWNWWEKKMNGLGGEDTVLYDTKDLNTYYVMNIDPAPTLNAISGSDTTSFTFGSHYGTKKYTSEVWAVPTPSQYSGMFGNYGSWLSSSKYFGYYDRDGKYSQAITYYSVSGDTSTSSWFGHNTKGNTNACGAAFEKPQTPYILTQVNALFNNAQFTKPVKLFCKVYKLKEIPDSAKAVPTVEGLVAYGETELNDSSIIYQSGRWGILNFELKQKYQGQDYQAMPEIDYPILVVVGGYDNPAITRFTLLVSRDAYDEGFGELGYLCNVDSAGNLLNARGFLGNWSSLVLHSAPSIFLQTMNTWLTVYTGENFLPNTDADRTTELSGLGEAKTLDFYSYMPSSIWGVKQADGSALPSWLKVSYKDQMNGESYKNHTDVTFTAEPLPEGVTYREAKLLFSYPGSRMNFLVKQGKTSSVSDVNAERQVASVAYYDLMGRQSAEPQQGINIKVTRYTDGTSASEKVIR